MTPVREIVMTLQRNQPIDVKITTENSSVVTKSVSPEMLCQELAGCTTISSGLLPEGARFYLKRGLNETFVFEVPAKVWDCRHTHGGNRLFKVPLPRMLVRVDLSPVNRDGSGNQMRMTNTYFRCLKLPLSSTSDRLYRFPLCNVYGDSHVCWGNVEYPVFTKPNYADLVRVPELFFQSFFNGDLDSDGNFQFNASGFRNTFGLFQALDMKEAFPVEYLIEAEEVEQWIRR
jgi:hypothetical protein